MSRYSAYALSLIAALVISILPAYGQAVISAKSGLVHYFDGAVTVAGQPLEAHLGKFTAIPEGAELRTEKGRAEVLLTPGVFLRVGENSAIRMLANSLSDTRVELLAGSAIVASRDPEADAPVTLIYKGWKVRQSEKGAYRIDCDPPRLQVSEGNAQASSSAGAPVQVGQGMELSLVGGAPAPATADPAAQDALQQWNEGRTDAISADNAVAANIQDPANLQGADPSMDAFTYYPMLPFASLGPAVGGAYGPAASANYGLYGASIYQSGFYSLYLPGYTRRPLGLPLPGLHLGLGLTSPIGLRPLPLHSPAPLHAPTGIGISRLPPQHAPVSRPAAPAHPGVHIGHR